jgi:hypothetical protein
MLSQVRNDGMAANIHGRRRPGRHDEKGVMIEEAREVA